MFNPLRYPIAFELPERLTPVSAWVAHIPFAMALVDVLRPSTIVELGTYTGESYCAFCQAVQRLDLGTRCYGVDTWKGDVHTGPYGPGVLRELRAHHDPRYASFSRLVESTFEDALGQLAKGSVDLLHLDGCHTYEACKHDFEAWLPKMSERGVVLLHDTNVREGTFGVWRLWEELRERFPCFEFVHGHGLGLVAVGGSTSAGLQALLGAGAAETQVIRRLYFTLGQGVALRRRWEAGERERERLAGEVAVTSAERDRALSQRDDAAQRAGDEAGTRARVQERSAALRAERDGLRVSVERLAQRVGPLEAQVQRLGREVDAVRAELEACAAERDAAGEEVEGARAELEACIADRDALGEGAETLRSEVETLRLRIRADHLSLGYRLVDLQRVAMDRLLPVHTRRRGPYVQSTRLLGRALDAGRRLLPGADAYSSAGTPAGAPAAPRAAVPEAAASSTSPAPGPRAAPPPASVPRPQAPIVRRVRAPLRRSVSVVVPTKNGEAEGLHDTLRSLRAQRGLGELQLVVVDSGSSDRTLEIARAWGAVVREVAPGDFNHGKTRGVGGDLATGDLILFTVQDAVLATDDVLYEMARMLEAEPELAVVSVRQVPRADADLFSCWQLWNHYNHLGRDTRVASLRRADELDGLDPRARWRRACVDDVCSLHRREVWRRLRFGDARFAEDVDYGLRALRAGYAVGFIGNKAVVHSHARPAAYQLSAHYVVRTTLAPLLGDVQPDRWRGSGITSLGDLLASVWDLYGALEVPGATVDAAPDLEPTCALSALQRAVEARGASSGRPAGPAGLDRLLGALGPPPSLEAPSGEGPSRYCREVFAWNLQHLLIPFFEGRYRSLPADALRDLTYKTFGMTVGAALGDFAAAPPRDGEEPGAMASLDEVLRRGIVG